MNISSLSWIYSAAISLFVICIFFLLGRYFMQYRYTPIGDLKNLSKHPDKYKLYLLTLCILMPSTEFLLDLCHLREKSLFLPNVFIAFVMFALFYMGNYITIIAQNLHRIVVVFYCLYSITAISAINSGTINIIALTELSGFIMFSYYVFYNIKHFFAYIFGLFFVLISLYLWGNLSIEILVLYNCTLLTAFGLNYSRHIVDSNIFKNLIYTYEIVNKGNILVVGVNKNGVVEFISENIQEILGCSKEIAIGKSWGNEIEAITGLRVEQVKAANSTDGNYIQKFSCTKKGGYKLIEWQDDTQNSNYTIKVGRDVTQRQQSEIELQKANVRLETLLRNSGDLVFVLDKNYVFTSYYHKNDEALFVQPDVFIGKKITEIGFPPETLNEIQTAIQKCQETNKNVIAEYFLPLANGIQWFSLNISMILSEQGELQEFICAARNITESKEAHNKLIESNNRLRLLEELINTSQDSYCITYEDGTIFYVNKVASNWFGIKPEEAGIYKVKDVEGKFGGREEDWQQHLAELKKNGRILMEGVNINQKTKESHPAEISVSYSVIDNKGYVTATIRDISERKKSDAEILAKNEALAASEKELKNNLERLQKAQQVLEKQKAEIASIKELFELAIKGSNDGIWDWDLRTNKVYFSPRWKSMLGYEDHEIEDSYETFKALQHPEYKEKIDETIQQYLAGESDNYYIEFPMLHKDGKYRWILARGAALRDSEGKPYRMSGSHSDITEMRKIQSELKQLSLVAEKTTNGVLIADMKARVVWANQAYLDMMQIPLSDIIGKRPRDIFEVHHYPGFQEKIAQINGSNYNLDIELSTYDKRRIWVEISNTIIKDDGDVPIQQIEIITDITERKQIQAASEKRQKILALHNKIISKISTTHFEQYESLEKVIQVITEAVAEGSSVGRASFWEYTSNSIICRDLYEQNTHSHSAGLELMEADFPNYFNGIRSGLAIIADDAITHHQTFEFAEIYLKPLNIHSMLDVAVRLSGELIGVLCLESTENARTWTSDDMAFARAISDMISLAIEADRRKKMEESLRESENNFRQINETIDDVFWLFDINADKMNYISPSCEKILGAKPEYFYQKNDFGLTYVLEEDLDKVKQAHKKVRETGYYEIEYRICIENNIRWIFEKAFAIRNNTGAIIKISGICSDITQEQATQEKIKQLSLVAEKATNGVLIEDKNGYVTWANQAFLEMFEISLPKLLNKKSSHLFDKETNLTNYQVLNNENFVVEKEVLTYTQKVKWIELNHTAIKDNNGNLVQQVEILTDITERKKHEQELLEKQAQLQQLLDVTSNQNQRLQNFAHIVSHNIRSHSSNLSMLTSFLNEPENDKEQKKFFDMLKLSTNKLAETVENLNEIITIQNNLNLPKTRLCMWEEIEKTTQVLNSIILANEVTVSNNVSKEVFINGLASYIESILLNMLTNAIKYRAEGRKPIIRFSAEKKGFFWILSIEDNGLGIDLNKHGHKLFGMYKTFHKNADARGIGLFITKNQIEAMGGKIEVESQVGIGTTFKIYFYAND